MDELQKNLTATGVPAPPKTPTDAQWLREHWRKGWGNNPDKGITPGGPPSFDPAIRYKDYVVRAKNPFHGGQTTPLGYGDWLRMQRWQNEVRAPHGYQTAEYRKEDSPEYWRTGANVIADRGKRLGPLPPHPGDNRGWGIGDLTPSPRRTKPLSKGGIEITPKK